MPKFPTVSLESSYTVPIAILRAIEEIQTRRPNVPMPQSLLQNGYKLGGQKLVTETRAAFPELPYHPNGTTGRKLNIISRL